MKKIFLVFTLILFSVLGRAQKTADVGIWGGAATYFGDLEQMDIGQSIKPNFGAYFRYNFNARVGLRVMYLTGNIGAQGTIQNIDWSFGKQVHDVSVQAEINYLKYILGVKKTPFTPYVLVGLGVAYYNYQLDPVALFDINALNNKGIIEIDEPVMAITVPFGMGIKASIGKRLGVGVELLFRKLADDKLDNLDDPFAHTNPLGDVIYTDYLHNNDYTAYLGLHLTYKLYLGKSDCPAYESKD